jgi:hypothetical protein
VSQSNTDPGETIRCGSGFVKLVGAFHMNRSLKILLRGKPKRSLEKGKNLRNIKFEELFGRLEASLEAKTSFLWVYEEIKILFLAKFAVLRIRDVYPGS